MAVHLTTGYPLKQGSTEIQLANLQQVVTSLIDELGHILYNLDSGNVLESARDKVLTKEMRETKEELDGKITENKTSIKQTADTIELHAESIEKHGETLSQHSTLIKQNADDITLHAESIKDNANNIASIKLTADGIQTQVSELKDGVGERFSMIEQNAGEIESQVVDLVKLKESTFIQNGEGFVLDGEKTAFTGVVYLTDNDKVNRFSLFYTNARGFEEVFIHSCTGASIPIIIGDHDGDVFIGWNSDGNEVATRQWVKDYVKDNAVAVYA